VVGQIEEFQRATGAGVLDLAFGAGGIGQQATLRSLRRFAERVLPKIRQL